eukprot:CAMPEP_0178696898 /NCGR_PEP_ID=MMETSP0699-20121125/9658_1 /TAXON_ID=265572 /ORGANISM="Extubocellulus spinifer, Strain CCMP396" /LENGTH=69 /DNA_ID=CAMNT_0020342741 /DNA_START=616 /DNA_END=823 /DNA_ORIENTATION=+
MFQSLKLAPAKTTTENSRITLRERLRVDPGQEKASAALPVRRRAAPPAATVAASWRTPMAAAAGGAGGG